MGKGGKGEKRGRILTAESHGDAMQSNEEWGLAFKNALQAEVDGGWWTRKPAAERASALGIQIGFYAKLAEPRWRGEPGKWWSLSSVACGRAWVAAEDNGANEAPSESPEQREQSEAQARLDQAKSIMYWAGPNFRFSIMSCLTMSAKFTPEFFEENRSANADGADGIIKFLPEFENALPLSDSDWEEVARALKTGSVPDPLSWVEARLLSQVKASAPAAAIRRI